MALGLPPPPPESWERWPQHHPTSADYAMMATGLLPYDHRPVTTAPLQRPALAPHFVAGPPFHLTSMTPVASPGTYHGSVHYAGYIPYSPPPAADAPFKPQHCVERPQPSEMHLEPGFQRPSDGCLSAERSPSPSIKSEAQMSTSAGSTVSDATTATSTSSKGLVPNVRINGAPVHQFHTPVDKLMRAIQAMMVDENSTDKAGSTQADQEKQTKTKPRRFCCDIPGCSKIFAQKNNLETHRRAHTGERPYVCEYCGRGFTQGVNLKTHIRRHEGIKPYVCPQCGKAFSQKGNVKQHMKTHDRSESWICKLDGCNKTFTTKGNLKPHQNKFHRDTIDAFFAKLAQTTDLSSLSAEDKEMAKYLHDLYPYANKGIKGRGKGCKVKRLAMPHRSRPHDLATTTSPIVNTNSSSPLTVHHAAYPMPLAPHGLHMALHTPPQPPAPPPPPPVTPSAHGPHHHHTHHHHHHPFHGLSSPAAYSITTTTTTTSTRPTSLLGMGHVHSSPPGMHLYEDDHGRDQLAFGDRMY